MSTKTYEQFKAEYLAHPDAEEAASDNETPERMEQRCQRVWTHYTGQMEEAIAKADQMECEAGEAPAPPKPKTKTKKTKLEDALHSAFAEVMRQNPWAEAPHPLESHRMYHTRVAREFGLAAKRVAPHCEVKSWAIYGGEDDYDWEYGVTAGPCCVILKRERPAA